MELKANIHTVQLFLAQPGKYTIMMPVLAKPLRE